jgi:hypothetical protein
MARDLTARQMDQRVALCNLWESGYVRVVPPEERALTPIVLVFFAKFIEAHHADLVLAGEAELTAMLRSPVPDAVSADIEAKLPAASTQTGIQRDCLRAVAYGLATGNAICKRQQDARWLFREVGQLFLEQQAAK